MIKWFNKLLDYELCILLYPPIMPIYRFKSPLVGGLLLIFILK